MQQIFSNMIDLQGRSKATYSTEFYEARLNELLEDHRYLQNIVTSHFLVNKNFQRKMWFLLKWKFA